MKAAARSSLLTGKKSANPAKVQTAYGENYQEGKFLKNKPNTSTEAHQKKSADPCGNIENTSSGRISKDVSSLNLEPKDIDKHKAEVLPSRDLSHKPSLLNEPVDPVIHASRDRAVCSQVESQSRKSLNFDKGEISGKIRRKERHGTDEFSNMESAVGANLVQTGVSNPFNLENQGTSKR